MKNELDNLLKAINLADLEGVKSVTIDVKDLLLLKSIIKDQDKSLTKAQREISVLEAKIVLQDMKSPVSLNSFIDVRV